MIKDFTSFLKETNALALAVGVILGGATNKVVSSLVDDLIMPPIGLIMQGGDWMDAQLVLGKVTDASGKTTVAAIKYGHLISTLIDFIIIAFVVFLISKMFLPKKAEA